MKYTNYLEWNRLQVGKVAVYFDDVFMKHKGSKTVKVALKDEVKMTLWESFSKAAD